MSHHPARTRQDFLTFLGGSLGGLGKLASTSSLPLNLSPPIQGSTPAHRLGFLGTLSSSLGARRVDQKSEHVSQGLALMFRRSWFGTLATQFCGEGMRGLRVPREEFPYELCEPHNRFDETDPLVVCETWGGAPVL